MLTVLEYHGMFGSVIMAFQGYLHGHLSAMQQPPIFCEKENHSGEMSRGNTSYHCAEDKPTRVAATDAIYMWPHE